MQATHMWVKESDVNVAQGELVGFLDNRGFGVNWKRWAGTVPDWAVGGLVLVPLEQQPKEQEMSKTTTTTTDDALGPCPSCGADAAKPRTRTLGEPGGVWCTQCGHATATVEAWQGRPRKGHGRIQLDEYACRFDVVQHPGWPFPYVSVTKPAPGPVTADLDLTHIGGGFKARTQEEVTAWLEAEIQKDLMTMLGGDAKLARNARATLGHIVIRGSILV